MKTTEGRLLPDQDARSRRICRALAQTGVEGRIYHVVADTPGQREDYIGILVDDRIVVHFELERGNPNASPVETKIYNVHEYQQGMRGVAAREFKSTLTAARGELAKLKARG